MLRVGLTGGLGSGKSTVARMLAARGAHVLSSDEVGRELMRPGEPVFQSIVAHFGPQILNKNETLDRAALARIVFDGAHPEQLAALNAIVHPAVIARQAVLIEKIASREPNAIVVVESAVLFETKHGDREAWHTRFDCIVLVRATEELKIERFLLRTLGEQPTSDTERARLTAEAQRRLQRQLPDEEKAAHADYVLSNNGSLAELERVVDHLWVTLQHRA